MPKPAGAEEIGVGSVSLAGAAAPPPETVAVAVAVREPSGRPGSTSTSIAR